MNVHIKRSASGQAQARKNVIGVQIFDSDDVVPPFAFNMREVVITFITSIGNNNGFTLNGGTVKARHQQAGQLAVR